jgi:hypothetical protein
MEHDVTQENEIYIQQVKELILYFSSIEDHEIRKMVVNLLRMVSEQRV